LTHTSYCRRSTRLRASAFCCGAARHAISESLTNNLKTSRISPVIAETATVVNAQVDLFACRRPGCLMIEARIERVAEALELVVQARLKRAPTQSELRDEAKKLLTAYCASRTERASKTDQLKAA
jgi:hypothetical protein